MIAQLQVLNKILETKDFSLVASNNLDESYFFNCKDEFNFIKNHYDMYRAIPDIETFKNTFPGFTITQVEEPDTYLLAQLYEDYNASYLASCFNNVKRYLELGEIVKAQEWFNKAHEGLHTGAVITCTDLMQDTTRFDRYLERTHDPVKFYLTTGFKELDDTIGGIDRENENMVIIARPGVGKCLAKGTKILMADGTVKAVDDIVVGDKVQSYNQVNTVQALHNGTSNGYKIIPNKGKPFIVSANHILTLSLQNEVYDKAKGCKTTNGTSQIIDIMIEDYLKASKHFKHRCKLFRPAINYDTKDQTIDPYILGAWLGDGISSQNQICSADQEIIDAIYNYGKVESYEVHDLPSQQAKCHIFSINGNGRSGYFRTKLKDLDLVDNKHIPLNYLTGDREQRLQLLAGLLDTDGCYLKSQAMFDFTNKNKVLFDNVAQLCRGLGFSVCIQKPKKIKAFTTDTINEYYRMTISGNIEEIPTKVKRKQAVKTNKNKSALVTGFTIEPVDYVEYYGFEADGDHRYLLSDNTLTHNTQILLKMAAVASMAGLRVGIFEGEMTTDKVGYRIDTFISHISNTAMNRGHADILNSYESYIKALPHYEYGPVKVMTLEDIPDGNCTVDVLKTFVEKEKLDILFVDQYDLMEDTHKTHAEHEHVAHIAKDMKKLQQLKKIPIISVCQMTRQKNEDGSQDTTQLAGSDKISRYATSIIALEQKQREDKRIELTLNIIKARDGGDHNKFIYTTNFNTGNFEYVTVATDEAEAAALKADYALNPADGEVCL